MPDKVIGVSHRDIAGEPLGAALRVTVDSGPQALALARSILEQP